MESCPVCERGEVFETPEGRKCFRCGVIVPRRTSIDFWPGPERRPRRRPDQDRISAMADYARTKEDKS